MTWVLFCSWFKCFWQRTRLKLFVFFEKETLETFFRTRFLLHPTNNVKVLSKEITNFYKLNLFPSSFSFPNQLNSIKVKNDLWAKQQRTFLSLSFLVHDYVNLANIKLHVNPRKSHSIQDTTNRKILQSQSARKK